MVYRFYIILKNKTFLKYKQLLKIKGVLIL